MLMDTRSAGRDGVTRGRRPETTTARGGNGLQPMERALLLQASPIMAGATTAQLLRLAAAAREVPLRPGTALVSEGDDPAIYLVVRGTLTMEPVGALPVVVQPGDAIGLYETLADLRAETPVVVSEAGAALRIDGPDLFDVLSGDSELLQALFGAFLRAGPAGQAVGSAVSPDRLFAV
jgi:hypothetical protein